MARRQVYTTCCEPYETCYHFYMTRYFHRDMLFKPWQHATKGLKTCCIKINMSHVFTDTSRNFRTRFEYYCDVSCKLLLRYGSLCNMLWMFMTHLQFMRRIMYFKKQVLYARNILRFHAKRWVGPTYDLNGQPYTACQACITDKHLVR